MVLKPGDAEDTRLQYMRTESTKDYVSWRHKYIHLNGTKSKKDSKNLLACLRATLHHSIIQHAS